MANGLLVRRSTEALAADPAALAALRDACQKMQALRADDNRSWIYWAGQHGYPDWRCWHHFRVGMGTNRSYNLFLPWHRAYLVYWENQMRDRNAGASQPWWDWTSARSHAAGVPEIFATPRVAGAANPLFNGPVPAMNGRPARRTVRFPGAPAELPAPAELDALLGLSDFLDFQEQLEDIHDRIHGWSGGLNPRNPAQGGDMGAVARAAFDPIFWAHHCMIDRIWYLWQLRHGLNNIPADYLSRPLAPFALTVQGVLDVKRLGYDYAVGVASAPAPR